MTSAPPIPPEIWKAIQAFLVAGKSGEVRLVVEAGQVVDGVLRERLNPRPPKR